MRNTNYDKIAETYKDYSIKISQLSEQYRELIKLAEIKNPKKWDVLEIGCGTGIILQSLANRFPKINSLAGIDLSSELIKIAQKNNKNEKIKLIRADMNVLPFENEKFDFVYSLYTVHYSRNLLKTLKEIHRVTKRGGTLFIQDAHPLAGFFRKKSKNYNIKETVSFPTAGIDSVKVTHPTFTIEEYITASLKAGWSIVGLRELQGARSLSLGLKGYSVPTKLILKLKKGEYSIN